MKKKKKKRKRPGKKKKNLKMLAQISADLGFQRKTKK